MTGSAALARDPQLLAEEPFLARRIVAGLDEVDADLADRDKTRIGERLLHRVAQALDVVFDSAGEPQRMHAQRVGKAMTMRDRARLARVVDDGRSASPACHAGRARPRHHVVAVRDRTRPRRGGNACRSTSDRV